MRLVIFDDSYRQCINVKKPAQSGKKECAVATFYRHPKQQNIYAHAIGRFDRTINSRGRLLYSTVGMS